MKERLRQINDYKGVMGMLGSGARFGTALIGLLLLGSGQAQSRPKPKIIADPYAAPYDNSKADRALRAYEKAHPECELWSNWFKLCSHTGPGGQTYCRVDREHIVKPSHPFCGNWNPRITSHIVLPEEEASIDRFVVHTRLNTPSPEGLKEFILTRPFGGLTVAQMANPICLKWQKAPRSNILRLLKRTRDQEKREILLNNLQPHVCAVWKEKLSCTKPVGGRDLVEEGAEIWRSYPISLSPIWGVHCKHQGDD